MRKYYQILGLTENASIDEIKRSYRKLAFHYHPDRNDSPGAQEKFLLIQEAYEVLTGKKKIAQPKVGDYSHRRTRPDESWEEKVKKARAKNIPKASTIPIIQTTLFNCQRNPERNFLK